MTKEERLIEAIEKILSVRHGWLCEEDGCCLIEAQELAQEVLDDLVRLEVCSAASNVDRV